MAVALHGRAVWLPELLKQVRQRLVAVTGYPPDSVFYTQLRDEDLVRFAPASKFLAVRVPSLRPDGSAFDGGGRLTAVYDATLEVVLAVRLNTDQEFRADRMMTDADGVFAQMKKVVDALAVFSPLDAVGGTVGLTTQPVRPAGAVSLNVRKAQDGTAWAVCVSPWSAPFVSDIPA